MKTKYYIGTSEVSGAVYDAFQRYKAHSQILAAENEKYKKVLEIARNKQIDFGAFIKANNREEYNQMVFYVKNELTKKEYDIVKEVIKP